ncbi:MAG TPA: molybdenum ABC transporter ATP-binding protein [Halothiobacillus sp.]|nr:molybdenum ABC transporter ATP-binding protein [Halothiobacillus sp.]
MIHGHLQLSLTNFTLDSTPFAFASEGVTVLFGRSGSGKSTLLRAMSGLDKRTHGQLCFQDEVWQTGKKSLPVERRDIGFVFQSAALLPHKNVQGNLDYARRRVPKDRQHGPGFEEIIDRVGISHLLDRPTNNLSGGERQRVAIARALLMRPRLLMMDEPLSALDWQAKSELLGLIESVIAEYRIPTLYITHAPIEVERLADRVVFMAGGRITSIETLTEATSRVDSPLFTEEGPVSVLHGTIGAIEPDGLVPFRSKQADAFTFWVSAHSDAIPSDANPHGLHSKTTRLRVLARDVAIASQRQEGISMLNQLACTITSIAIDTTGRRSGRAVVFLELIDGQPLLAELSHRSVEQLGLVHGQRVFALVKTAALIDP